MNAAALLLGVDTGPPPSGGTLIDDAFSDTNGTALSAHTIAPTNTPGTSWTVSGATWTIQSNALALTQNSAAQQVALCDAGQSDVTVQATFAVGGTEYAAIVARAADISNLLLAEGRPSDSHVYLTVVSGGSTINQYSAAHVWANGDVVTLACSGTTVKVSVNGTVLITQTVSAGQFNTKVGFHVGQNADTTSVWDDFTVTHP